MSPGSSTTLAVGSMRYGNGRNKYCSLTLGGLITILL